MYVSAHCVLAASPAVANVASSLLPSILSFQCDERWRQCPKLATPLWNCGFWNAANVHEDVLQMHNVLLYIFLHLNKLLKSVPRLFCKELINVLGLDTSCNWRFKQSKEQCLLTDKKKARKRWVLKHVREKNDEDPLSVARSEAHSCLH